MYLLIESIIKANIPIDPSLILTTLEEGSVSVYNLSDSQLSEWITKIREFGTKKILYVIITINKTVRDELFKANARFLFCGFTENVKDYINLGRYVLKSECVPKFNTHRHPAIYPAGVLPMVMYEGEIYCLMGIDKSRMKYSDFGGGYDREFKNHRSESFKNEVLQKYRIKDGYVHPFILADHLYESSNDLRIEEPSIHQNSSKFKACNKSKIEEHAIHSSNFRSLNNSRNVEHAIHRYSPNIKSLNNTRNAEPMTRRHSSNFKSSNELRFEEPYRRHSDPNISKNLHQIGHGDINTKYVAFREMFEETTHVDKTKNVIYSFDLEKTFRKLFVDKSFMYLGGEPIYGYDMFVTFYKCGDLVPDMKRWFLQECEKYKNDENEYINKLILPITKDSDIIFKFEQNHEMVGVSMIPLKLIVNEIIDINYRDFEKLTTFEKKTTKEQFSIKKEIIENLSQIYESSLLGNLRTCFGNAMIKYKQEFAFLADPEKFEMVKSILRL